MSERKLKYIVYAPTFDVDSGGTIFLHELVNVLNNLGEDAYLWPMAPVYKPSRMNRLSAWLRPQNFACDPALNTPIAQETDLRDDTIVVYPELVLGNPLGAKNVARWLLYKPGKMHPYEFGKDEMFFRAFEKADLPELTGGAPELFLWKVNNTYRNENRADRKGVCYIVRKGSYKDRISVTEEPDAIQIDKLSHAEVNDIFNRCDVFYSYDEATMYSQYAAICGCLSIVVPGDHASRAEWAAEHDLYNAGIAYGLDDTEHALATRDQVADVVAKKEQAGIDTVKNFVRLTKERFCAP